MLLVLPHVAGAASPVTTTSSCGLLDANSTPVPGSYSDTPSGPAVGAGTPTNPVVEEMLASGTFPSAPPLNFHFTCSASTNTRGPVVRSKLDFDGFAFNNQSYSIVSSSVGATAYFSVEAVRAGGPAIVPIVMVFYQDLDVFMGLGSNLSLGGSVRVSPPSVPGFGGVLRVAAINPESITTSNCIDDPACHTVDTLMGDADVGTEYSYSFSTLAFVSGILATPSPLPARASLEAYAQSFVYIDPTLEFAPGRRFVDYFEIVHSSNLMPTGVRRNVPAGVGPGDNYHMMFVTSQKRTGTSPDIQDYNDFVNQVADDAGIGPNSTSALGYPVEWYAVGSTETLNARDNARVDGAIYRIDGALLAEDFFDLWDGDVLVPPDADESGLQVEVLHPDVPNTLVFTGTRSDGTGNQTAGTLGTVVAASGRADYTDDGWVDELGLSSPTERRFYAISEALLPEPSAGLTGTVALGLLAFLRARARRPQTPRTNPVHGPQP